MTSIISYEKTLQNSLGADAIGWWMLNEGSGSSVNNLGSSGGYGTVTSGAWITDGPNSRPALRHAGTTRVNVGSVTIPTSTTVSAWVRCTSTSQMPIFSNRSGTGSLYFGMSAGKFFVWYNSATPSPSMVSVKTINDNKWHYLTWSSDGTTSKMFIDGKIDTQQAQARSATTDTAYIGYDASNNEYFAGDISGVVVFDTNINASGMTTPQHQLGYNYERFMYPNILSASILYR